MLQTNFINTLSTNLTYTPTSQQAQLLIHLTNFVLTPQDNTLFVLKGYAGTGKSSLLGALVKTLNQYRIKCVLLSPTGRAAKVFAAYAGVTALTIHKKIYRQKRFSPDMLGFSLSENRHKDTLFIVDEASMISDSTNDAGGNLLTNLLDYVYSSQGCRAILIGDSAQLPPVGQSDSPALNSDELRRYMLQVKEFELTDVVRQETTSGILHNATKLRKIIESQLQAELKLDIKNFPDIKRLDGETLVEEIESAYSRDGIEESIIITRTNKRANIFNQGVRNRLLYREEELSSGDLLLIAKNNYFWGDDIEEIGFIANGDVARVVRVHQYTTMYGFRFADVTLHLLDYEVDLDAKIILDTLHIETPSLNPEANTHLFNRVMEDYSDVLQKRERIKCVKADIWFNAMQVKYAYAVTCHKAQGGEWKNVFIDLGNINMDNLNIDFYRWLYTAFTRATQNLYLVNAPDRLFD